MSIPKPNKPSIDKASTRFAKIILGTMRCAPLWSASTIAFSSKVNVAAIISVLRFINLLLLKASIAINTHTIPTNTLVIRTFPDRKNLNRIIVTNSKAVDDCMVNIVHKKANQNILSDLCLLHSSMKEYSFLCNKPYAAI